MTAKTILIVGNSHTAALKQALENDTSLACGAVSFQIRWLIGDDRSQTRRTLGDTSTDDARRLIARLDVDDMLVLALFGSGHNVLGLLRHDRPFALASTAVSGNDELIPERVMYDTFVGFQRKMKAVVVALQAEAPCPVYHLATPAPKEDDSHILQATSSYRERPVTTVSLNPPLLRGTLWQLEMRAVRDVCEGSGIRFVNVPVGSTTDDGLFLRREYYGRDVTHGNEAYGALVLRQLANTRMDQSSERSARDGVPCRYESFAPSQSLTADLPAD